MKTISQSRRTLKLCLAVAVLIGPLALRAQQSATRIVVGFPPGGNLDYVARTIAPALGRELGQNFIVENKAGANGVIAGEFVSRAAPDMKTLWLTSVGAVAITPALTVKMTYDAERDLMPIAQVVRNVEVLLVNINSPYNTAAELVAAARRGTKLSFASSSTGGVPHLAIELLNDTAKIDIQHVPYKGGGPALNDLLAGHVDGLFSDISPVIGHITGGKVKVIGITSPDRHPLLPQIKTFDEMGLPGVDADNWQGLFAPKGANPVEVAKIGAALRRVLNSPAIKSTLESSGAEIVGSSAAELTTVLKKDIVKWGNLIKTKSIKGE
jgi:tripartite-type tricarboxylate transporter receptor subunit TctC